MNLGSPFYIAQEQPVPIMKLLADKTGELFLNILLEDGDQLLVQFISNDGEARGKPFKDSLSGLLSTGWTHRSTSTAIGWHRFKNGCLEDAQVSFALHRRFPWGRKVRLPTGEIFRIASYANTNPDGYYMYLSKDNGSALSRKKITPEWELLPRDNLLSLPFYPKPRTQQEIDTIKQYDLWAGGY